MSALFCLPKREQSSVLNALEVRCLVDPAEIARWNDLVCKHHYLENANLVGEQLRRGQRDDTMLEPLLRRELALQCFLPPH